MYPISICLIGKNEELHIDECLGRLSKLDAELVFVDTGSTDKTRELASKYTKAIYDFAWCDDFAKARNYALSCASNDIILFIDCDEYLEESDLAKTYKLVQQYPNAVGQITLHSLCYNSSGKQTVATDLLVRLFNKKKYTYEGAIHEQIVPIQKSGDNSLSVFEIPMSFLHMGYSGNPEALAKKADRDIHLLLKELDKHPEDPYIYYQLGQAYLLKNDYENAFQILDKGFYLDIDETLPYVKMMITDYGNSMLETGRYEKAASLEGVFEHFKTYADFVCMLGNAFLKVQRNEEALNLFAYELTLTDYSVEGATTYVPLHNIGCIYDAYDMYEQAIEAYSKAAALGNENSKQRLDALKQRMG